MIEIWKSIKGYEGQYEISSLGKVKRLHHYIDYEYKGQIYKKEFEEAILNSNINNYGFNAIGIKGKTYRICRLVADMFLEQPELACKIKHINNIKTDDRVENICWEPLKSKEHKRQVSLEYGRKYNKNPNRRAWYKQREKHPDYIKYLQSLDRRYNNYKRNTLKNRGLEFSLTKEYYIDLVNKPCYYCSKSLLKETGVSLDRIDNSKGYIENNVLPCCGNCNKIRGDRLTVKEMEIAMAAIIRYRLNQTKEGLIPAYDSKRSSKNSSKS